MTGSDRSVPPVGRWIVRNQTPQRLRVERDKGRLELAPLQTVHIESDPNAWGAAAEQARSARALTWEHEPVRSSRERYAAALVLVTAGALVSAVVASVFQLWFLTAVTGGAAVAAGSLAGRLVEGRGADAWQFATDVLMRALAVLVVVLVVVVGLGLPFTAAVFGTEVLDVLQAIDWQVGLYPQVQQLLTARAVQFLLVGVLTLLPALLYFQFDRERVETLLDRWLHHIFRFDPRLRTLDDVDARYGRRLEEVYGRSVSTSAGEARQRTRSRSPMVIATLLLGLGWVLVLINTDTVPVFTDEDLPDVTTLFDVRQSPISFAFLGAYLYGLQVVLRGYVRGDLRPKTYAAISVRVVVSFVLAWALDGILAQNDDAPSVLGLAFLAGVVPDTVLRYLRDAVGTAWRWTQGRVRAANEPDDLADRWPLTDLEGIDLYERTRLAEEGITNVQALAHHDVVDLTLSTRIPFERVVHWVDQAVLYEHVAPRDRSRLRRYGVLTATDLVRAGAAHADTLARVLDEGRLGTVLAALDNADWLPNLLAWRAAAVAERAPVLAFPEQPTGAAVPAQGGPATRARRIVLAEPPTGVTT